MKALVVTPTAREAAALGGLEPLVTGTGPGADDALRVALGSRQPSLVVIAGVCGGLDPSLAAGTIILGRSVRVAGEDDLLPDQPAYRAVRSELRKRRARFVSSSLLTVPAPVATRDAKTGLWNEHGAGGVDMETYWLARAAAAAGVPWVAIRVVVDPAGQSLPALLGKWDGGASEPSILRQSLTRPGQWPGFIRLGISWPKVRRRLARVTRLAVAVAEQQDVGADIPLETIAPR